MIANSTQSFHDNNNNRKWTIKDFCNIQKVGGGKFGSVCKAVEKNSNKQIALKVIEKKQLEKYDFFGQMKKEIEIHYRLRHPNIVRLYGYFYDQQNIYMVLELVPYGNLYHLLKKVKQFTEDQTRVIIKQIINAVLFMQERNIIHRDIKPENILIANLEHLTVKMCDFGWSTHTIDERRMTFCGTVDYVAPELIVQEPYDDKIDIWAIGILTYELLVGSAPFTGSDEKETYNKITKLDLKCCDQYQSLSCEAKDFISQILVSQPKLRLGLMEMINHPWFSKTKND